MVYEDQVEHLEDKPDTALPHDLNLINRYGCKPSIENNFDVHVNQFTPEPGPRFNAWQKETPCAD
jgi:hypothetical protein